MPHAGFIGSWKSRDGHMVHCVSLSLVADVQDCNTRWTWSMGLLRATFLSTRPTFVSSLILRARSLLVHRCSTLATICRKAVLQSPIRTQSRTVPVVKASRHDRLLCFAGAASAALARLRTTRSEIS